MHRRGVGLSEAKYKERGMVLAEDQLDMCAILWPLEKDGLRCWTWGTFMN
uniref:Uncharacterized protein n=1 Tax=Aotus nancymaae TaxID=37293 RepID=A0A2K5EGD9_AOTNA